MDDFQMGSKAIEGGGMIPNFCPECRECLHLGHWKAKRFWACASCGFQSEKFKEEHADSHLFEIAMRVVNDERKPEPPKKKPKSLTEVTEKIA